MSIHLMPTSLCPNFLTVWRNLCSHLQDKHIHWLRLFQLLGRLKQRSSSETRQETQALCHVTALLPFTSFWSSCVTLLCSSSLNRSFALFSYTTIICASSSLIFSSLQSVLSTQLFSFVLYKDPFILSPQCFCFFNTCWGFILPPPVHWHWFWSSSIHLHSATGSSLTATASYLILYVLQCRFTNDYLQCLSVCGRSCFLIHGQTCHKISNNNICLSSLWMVCFSVVPKEYLIHF